jgi:hypothetical protein
MVSWGLGFKQFHKALSKNYGRWMTRELEKKWGGEAPTARETQGTGED